MIIEAHKENIMSAESLNLTHAEARELLASAEPAIVMDPSDRRSLQEIAVFLIGRGVLQMPETRVEMQSDLPTPYTTQL